MTIVTTELYFGLNLSTLLNTILYELGQLEGTTANYDKFTRAFLVRKLNDRQNKFVFHSKCLRRMALLRAKADYREYKLPSNCMDAGVIGYPKYYQSSTSYTNLLIKTKEWLDDHHEGWLVEDSSEPMYAYMGDSYGNIPMMGVYPPPDTDGTDYTITPDTGVVTGGDLPGTTSNISGAATGAGTNILLQDATVADFTALGLVAGMACLNVTDGSTAYISSVAVAGITTTALAGGTDNLWSAGDSYNILAGEYGVITSWEDEEIVIFASEVGEITNITVPAGNIYINYVPYPISFPESGNDLQYPEIPKLYHMDFAMGVVADCLRTFTEGSKEFERAAYYDSLFNNAMVLARTKKSDRPFNEPPVSFRPGKRRRN